MNMFRINLFSNSHRCSYYDGASLFLRVFGLYQYNLYSLSGKKFENKVKLDCSNRFANHFNFRIYGFGSIMAYFVSMKIIIMAKLYSGIRLPKKSSSFLPV
jgi:hypothetical protein